MPTPTPISFSRHLTKSHVGEADLESRFEELALRHTARHGFRTYDVLHVSLALLLECDTFWSFDTKALKLAALEGLKTAASKN